MINEVKKSYIYRRFTPHLKKIPKKLALTTANPEAYKTGPPILVNSFPKSGTHLLEQLVEPIPNVKNYDNFVASNPPSFKRRQKEEIFKEINQIAPNELVRAHLFYDEDYDKLLKSKNVVHYFIYRDLRDVIISEANYLTNMATKHILHPYLKDMTSEEERISFVINGSEHLNYPNISDRFKRSNGWLYSGNVFPIKFEDLINSSKKETVESIIDYYCESTKHHSNSKDKLVMNSLNNINPNKSHTFNSGKQGKWKERFTEKNKEEMKEVAGDLLINLGYEKDKRW